MAVVESLTKPWGWGAGGGHEAHLDHFGDMVGVFRFFPDLRIVAEMPPKPAWRNLAIVESLSYPVGGHKAHLNHFQDMVGVFCFFLIYVLW